MPFRTRPRKIASRRFTLIEVVVVVVILMTAAGIAAVALKPEQPLRKLERIALEFQNFCARARFQAMESGSDRAVVWDRESERFLTIDPGESEEDAAADENFESKSWRLPDDVRLDWDALAPDDDDFRIELFRFFPDGGACGQRKFILTYKETNLVLEISALTGAMRMRESVEEDWE